MINAYTWYSLAKCLNIGSNSTLNIKIGIYNVVICCHIGYGSSSISVVSANISGDLKISIRLRLENNIWFCDIRGSENIDSDIICFLSDNIGWLNTDISVSSSGADICIIEDISDFINNGGTSIEISKDQIIELLGDYYATYIHDHAGQHIRPDMLILAGEDKYNASKLKVGETCLFLGISGSFGEDPTAGAGLDLEAMWTELGTNSIDKIIDISHIPIIPTFKISGLSGLLDTKASISHTHSQYALIDHTHAQYLTNITSAQVVTALGFTPLSSADARIQNWDAHITDTVKHITATERTNWNTAAGWGDHSVQGYLKNGMKFKPSTLVLPVLAPADLLAGETGFWLGAGEYAGTPGSGGVSSWLDLQDKPTTVAGFCITDVYTKQQISSLLDTKANISHTHSQYALTDHTHAQYSLTSHAHAWGDIVGKPSSFTPAAHSHSEYFLSTGNGMLSFDSAGRPVMNNNQGYACKVAGNKASTEVLWISTDNNLYIGSAASAYKNNIVLIGTNILANDKTIWHAGNSNLSSIDWYAKDMYTTGWFYCSGQGGWYNSKYGGGIYMRDTAYVTVSHERAFQIDYGGIDALTINNSGGVKAKRLCLDRLNGPGGISFYSTAYSSWQMYMSPPGGGAGTLFNVTAPAGSYVNSWALRSFIENSSGYGWTWESGNSTSTTPTVVAELRSSDGLFRTIGPLMAGNLSSTDRHILQAKQSSFGVLQLKSASSESSVGYFSSMSANYPRWTVGTGFGREAICFGGYYYNESVRWYFDPLYGLYLTNLSTHGGINIESISSFSWGSGRGALNKAIINDDGQTPLVVAFRAGTEPATAGADRLFAMELLNSGVCLRFYLGTNYSYTMHSNRHEFTGKINATGALEGAALVIPRSAPAGMESGKTYLWMS